MITRRHFMIAAGGLVASTGAVYAANEAYDSVQVSAYDLNVPQWPQGFTFTAGLLSDIHLGLAGMTAARLEGIARATQALACDSLFLLGDYADGSVWSNGHQVAPETWGDAISGLHASCGVYGIAGNHDWKRGIHRVRKAFDRARLPLLQNQALRVAKDGRALWIAGLDSQWGRSGFGEGTDRHDDMGKTLAHVTDDAPAILLMHEPDIFERVPGRFPVIFSGHTHGGQINLPIIGRPAPLMAPHRFIPGLIYGHKLSADSKKQMIITSGVGCSNLPVRIGVPPEIVRVTLRGTGPA
jgi:predicted MPP superfamily phosphohydrolase